MNNNLTDIVLQLNGEVYDNVAKKMGEKEEFIPLLNIGLMAMRNQSPSWGFPCFALRIMINTIVMTRKLT